MAETPNHWTLTAVSRFRFQAELFVVDKLTLGKVFLRVLLCLPVSASVSGS
jgi:hypothetical protein